MRDADEDLVATWRAQRLVHERDRGRVAEADHARRRAFHSALRPASHRRQPARRCSSPARSGCRSNHSATYQHIGTILRPEVLSMSSTA